MKLTEIYRKYKTLKKYRKNSQEFIPKLLIHQAFKGIVSRHRQKLPFLAFSQKTPFLAFLGILGILGYTPILGILGDPSKKAIFQEFPNLTIFGVYPNFGYFGEKWEIGYFGENDQNRKKGDFWGKCENWIYCKIGKNDRFVQKCQK